MHNYVEIFINMQSRATLSLPPPLRMWARSYVSHDHVGEGRVVCSAVLALMTYWTYVTPTNTPPHQLSPQPPTLNSTPIQDTNRSESLLIYTDIFNLTPMSLFRQI